MNEFQNKIIQLSEKMRKLIISLDSVLEITINGKEENNVSPTLRTLRTINRRLGVIRDESANDIGISNMFQEALSKELDALERLLNNISSYDSINDLTYKTIESAEIFLSFARLIREVTDNVLVNYRDTRERNDKLISIDEIYSKTKLVSDEIIKDYEKLSFITSKIKEQQSRIDDLEQRYRKSVKNITFDEEEFKNRQAIIDYAYNISEGFLNRSKKLDSEIQSTTDNAAGLIKIVDELEGNTEAINRSLNDKISEVDGLIIKTNEALGNATTVMLGGHFKDQYEKSKKGAFVWAIVGGLFLVGAITQCMLAVFLTNDSLNGNDNDIHYLISRLLIAPLFLIGTWFCANQYIKQKNIIEDYAYKKVLSLSLLSIKSEIEKTGADNTTEFIRAVQKEIMKSPLDSLDRKHLNREVNLLKGIHSETMKNVVSILSKNKEKEKRKNKSNKVNDTTA